MIYLVYATSLILIALGVLAALRHEARTTEAMPTGEMLGVSRVPLGLGLFLIASGLYVLLTFGNGR